MKYTIKSIKNKIDKLNVPWTSRIFSHPVAIVLVYLMANFTRITPNIITIVSFLFRLGAVYFVFTNHLILIAVMALVAQVLDSADGVLARTIKKTSKFGAALDPILDRIGYSSLFFALIYKLSSVGMFNTALLVFIMFFMYSNEIGFLETCTAYKEEEKFVKKNKLKSRMVQFKILFSIPIFGFLLKKYVTLMAKIRTNPIPSLIESYFLVFVIAPFFRFNYWLLLIGLLLYIPQFLFSFLRTVITIRRLKKK